MAHRYSEEELVEFLFRAQGGKCAWCGEPLDPDGRGSQWELHHHPAKSWRRRAFGEDWKTFLPEIPINMRLICLDCHDYPHGGRQKPRPFDPLL